MPDMTPDVLAMLDEVAKRSAGEAVDAYCRKQKKEERSFRDRRLRNTKKLLENYRQLKKHAETAVYSSMQEEVEQIINEMWDPHNRSEQIIFSIKTSATKTRIILAHVDAELEQYKNLCYSSPDRLLRDRADALFARYIDEDEKSVNQIARDLHVDRRTAQRYIKKALDDVSAFMFGIDGIVIFKDDYDNAE